MKMKSLFFVSFSCLFLGCVAEDPQPKQAELLVDQLPEDPLFIEFMNSLQKSQANASRISKEDFEKIQQRVISASSFAEVEKDRYTLSGSNLKIEHPLLEMVILGQKLREKYPQLLVANREELDMLLAENISELVQKRSVHSANLRIFGACEEEFDTGIETCRNAALVASAACGLLTPTLLGALACGGFVYLSELVCIDDATKSYKTCKKYEN
jgi:hypothetical protein